MSNFFHIKSITQMLNSYGAEKPKHPLVAVSEIAYQLGFEHPPYFSRLFKKKTDLFPFDFRMSLD